MRRQFRSATARTGVVAVVKVVGVVAVVRVVGVVAVVKVVYRRWMARSAKI